MREGIFNIHSKGYPERFHKTEVKYSQGETIAEAIAIGHFENEEALLRAAYGQFNIRASAALKVEAEKDTATAESLAGVLQGYQIKAERQKGGGGGNPEALAAARATRAAQKEAKQALDEARAQAEQNPELAAALATLRAAGVKV